MARKMHLSTHIWVIGVTAWAGAIPRRDVRLAHESGRVRFASVDITSELQVHSLQTRLAAPHCADCQRRLLPGETLHVYESGRSLCTLCAAAKSEPAQRRERIHAASAPLAVVPRAA